VLIYFNFNTYTYFEDFFQGNRFLTFKEFCSKFKIKTNFLNYSVVYAMQFLKSESIFLKDMLLDL